SSVSSLKQELEQLPDKDLQASLVHLGPPSRAGKKSDSAAGDGEETRTSAEALAVKGIRYRRLRPHAKGGLGEVFVALDAELNREVALKEIQAHFAEKQESRARFLREAEITGRLEHPGIVPVYGLGADSEGRPFYAMRFI